MSYSRRERLHHQLLANWKWFASFFKNPDKWQLEDFPVIVRRQDNSDFTGPSRLKPVEWVAAVVRWPITGGGKDRQEAIDDLRAHVEQRREESASLPRPGTKVPIKFASQEHISRFPGLEEDFVRRVLQVDWAWLSDESSLWHFHEQEDNTEFYRRIKEVYGVDVSDLPDDRIAAILERIAESRL